MILALKLLLIFWALGIGFAVLMVVKPLPAFKPRKKDHWDHLASEFASALVGHPAGEDVAA